MVVPPHVTAASGALAATPTLAAVPPSAEPDLLLSVQDADDETPARRRRTGDREHMAEYQARTAPGAAASPAASRLVDLVRGLGAVALGTAVSISTILDGRAKAITYRASLALEAAGVIRRAWAKRDLRHARAPGLGIVLLPGPLWDEWHEARFPLGVEPLAAPGGSPRPTALPVTASDRQMREQVGMATELLRRVIEGWTVATGDAWLTEAVDMAIAKLPPTGPSVALSRARDSGRLRVTPEQSIVGLLPPAGTGATWKTNPPRRDGKRKAKAPAGPLPCVLVGGGWTTRTEFVATVKLTSYAAPYEVIASGRGATDAENLRRLVWKHAEKDRGYCPHTSIRTSNTGRQRALGAALDAALLATPRDVARTRLQAWLRLTAEV